MLAGFCLSCSNSGVYIYHADCFYCHLSSLCTQSRARHKHFSTYRREDVGSTKEKNHLRVSVLLSPRLKIQPIITLEGSVAHTFQRGGKNKVTVQVASGSTMVQDSRDITVKGESGGGRPRGRLPTKKVWTPSLCSALRVLQVAAVVLLSRPG